METLSPFLQVIVVVVTVAFLAMAYAVVRALGRFARAAESFTEPTGAVAKLVENASRTSTEARELVVRLDAVAENVAGVAEKFRGLSDRAFNVSSAILDEVEPPVRQAVYVARGIRAGAGLLMERWAGGRNHNPQEGQDHE